MDINKIIRLTILVILCLSIISITIIAFFNGSDWFGKLMEDHFKAIIGLPAAALTSMTLVLVLKQTAGPIEFKGLSFEFKGTSGEVILWVICFLSIVYSIDKLW